MGKGCKIMFNDCDPEQAKDRSLPYNTYLVEYLQDGMTHFDIASAPKQVDIFDDYWDKYHSDFVNMTQTEGRVNPKLWTDPKDVKKEKSKK